MFWGLWYICFQVNAVHVVSVGMLHGTVRSCGFFKTSITLHSQNESLNSVKLIFVKKYEISEGRLNLTSSLQVFVAYRCLCIFSVY